MKNRFILFAALCLTMASCYSIDRDDIAFEMEQKASVSRSGDGTGTAYVRIGMFENLDNHTVSITDISFEGANSEIAIPEFGTNISAVSFISASSSNPSFDTADGRFHSVKISPASTSITIRFSAVVSAEDGSYSFAVENVKHILEKSKNVWENNCSYSYLICVDEQMLGLQRITYDPTVNDYDIQ